MAERARDLWTKATDSINYSLNRRKIKMAVIKRKENYIDKKLAELFARVMVISGGRNDKKFNYATRSLCFSEIEMGRIMFMMAKTNIVLNFRLFAKTFLSFFNFGYVRNFVLLNYGVLVSEDYLRQIGNQFSLRKRFSFERDFMRKRLVGEFVDRFGFLIQFYKNKIDSKNADKDLSLWKKTMIFIPNILERLSDKLREHADDIMGFVFDQVKELLTFLPSIPIFQPILESLLEKLFSEVLRLGMEFYRDNEVEIKSFVHESTKMFRKYLFSSEIQSLNYERILDEYGWISYVDDFPEEIDQFNVKLSALEQDSSKKPSSEVFEVMKHYQIEQKYQQVLGKASPSSDVQPSDALLKYSGDLSLFHSDGYLMSESRLILDSELLEEYVKHFRVSTESSNMLLI